MRSAEPCRHRLCVAILVAVSLLVDAPARGDGDSPPLAYPPARRADVVDRYHQIPVHDPYRWLEDHASDETASWLSAQRETTRQYFERLPGRAALRRRLETLWDFPRCGLPESGGGRLFFQRVDGLQNQPVLYVLEPGEKAPRVLVDPNHLDPLGLTSICGWSASPDGRHVAYALMVAGSDHHAWRIRDVDAGRDLPERLATVLHNEIAWSPRSDGFYYARSNVPPPAPDGRPGPERVLRIKFHRLGDEPERDATLYERGAERDAMCDVRLSGEGRWLVARRWRGLERNRRVFLIDLREQPPVPRWLIASPAAYYQFAGVLDGHFVFQTDHAAPRGKVVAVDPRRPAPEYWRTLVPQSDDALVETTLVGARLVVRGLRDAASIVRRFDREGAPLPDLPLPTDGTLTGFQARGRAGESFFAYTSHASPPRVFRWRLADDHVEEFLPSRYAFDPTAYRTELVHYASGDGTRIPMRITRRADREPGADTPVLLHGYGGFHIPTTPTFSLTHLAWLDLGGALATPCLRGGGEFGRSWHDAGRGPNKSVAVDDFLHAARWLVANERTRPERLAIRGVSNGGLLAAAAMVREPELFGAAVPTVAPLDMLRYHRLPRGWAWIDEYGTADEAEQFRAILAYSPLHNLRPRAKYPATLIMTGERDERVVPAHSYKFAAALQAAQGGTAPCLMRLDHDAGHGAGTATPKLLDAAADLLAFLCHALHVDPTTDDDAP